MPVRCPLMEGDAARARRAAELAQLPIAPAVHRAERREHHHVQLARLDRDDAVGRRKAKRKHLQVTVAVHEHERGRFRQCCRRLFAVLVYGHVGWPLCCCWRRLAQAARGGAGELHEGGIGLALAHRAQVVARVLEVEASGA